MKRRLGGILLALALVLSLAPALGGSARAASPTKVCIITKDGYHEFTNVTSGSNSQTVPVGTGVGTGTATYYRENHYLVLENYVADGSGICTVSGSDYGIYSDGDLTIGIKGTCSLSSTGGSSADRFGIYALGDLEIYSYETSGNHKLTVNMGKTAAGSASGIQCGGKLTIKDSNISADYLTVDVTGSGVSGSGGVSSGLRAASMELKTYFLKATGGAVTDTSAKSCGIYATGAVSVKCDLWAAGGSANNTQNSDSGSFGIWAKSLTATDGTLDTTGGQSKAGKSAGIYTTGALAVDGALVRSTGGTVTESGCSYGVYASTIAPLSTVVVNVTSGTLTATGGTVSGAGYSYGVYASTAASGSTVEVKVTNGTLNATGGNAVQGRSCGLYAEKLTLSGGTVNATGGNALKSRGADSSSFTMSGGTLTAVGGKATGVGGTITSPNGSAGLELPGGDAAHPISFTGGSITARGGTAPTDAAYSDGSYGVWFGKDLTSKLSLTTGGTLVAQGNTAAARFDRRLTAPKLLCGAAYDGSDKKVASTDSLTVRYAELRTDSVGVAVVGWDYGAWNESKNGPFYCKAAGVEITYAGRGGTTYASSTDRPENVGTYTVTAKYGSMTATADFMISQRDLKYADIRFTDPQATYNGDSLGVRVQSVTCDNRTLAAGTDYTVTSGNTATNVGYTLLTLTGTGNYKGTCAGYWTLQKATPTEEDFWIPVIARQPYTGAAAELLKDPPLRGGRTGIGEITILYNGSVDRPVGPGSYTVTFDVAEGGNYKSAKGLAYGTLTIGPELVGSVKGTTLTYSVIDAPSNAMLIVAWYNDSGRMLGMNCVTVSSGDTEDATLSGVGSGAASCRLFLVDRNSFTPVSGAVTASKE
ncbi:MAG: hypothetical protein E7425_08335 [Ruminococcaceae bacterium]|nr:hypothetical protein [Oscillospiraceae bacterium]